MKITIQNSLNELSKAIDAISLELDFRKVKKTYKIKTLLFCEELLVELSKNEKIKEIDIEFKKVLGQHRIVFSYSGDKKAFNLEELFESRVDLSGLSNDDDAEMNIRRKIIKSYSNSIKTSYSKNRNIISLLIGNPALPSLIVTLSSIFLGLLLGVLGKFLLPENFINGATEYVLSPLRTGMLKLLSFIIGPLVFFSLVDCIGSFSDMKTIGKLGTSTLIVYISTGIVAVCLGFLTFFGFNALGCFDLLPDVSSFSGSTASIQLNFIDTLLSFIPDSFLGSFISNNIIQIIICALIFGTAIIMLGKRGTKIKNFFSEANELMTKIMTLLSKLVPLFIFVSVILIFFQSEVSTLSSMLNLTIAGAFSMIFVLMMYLILVAIFARSNPFVFFKNAFSGWINAFTLCSSTVAIPKSREVCEKNLKIDPRISSFTIPLGATINMDGVSAMFVVLSLFLAKAFGIEMTAGSLILLGITIVLVSMSAPGVSGGGVVCAITVITSIGIPAEAIALVIGIISFLEPLATASNVFGDITASYVISKNIKLGR